ncbi:hypothetical protein [Brevundimonas sp. FT23028]|uniref:hypothetical protein n=1 Tax=Brevundimonas sp. FT23028 TaxID=3393748 RepID=UPI003B589C07
MQCAKIDRFFPVRTALRIGAAITVLASTVACSAEATQTAKASQNPALPSRAHVDGALLRTGGGGLVGILDVQRDAARPETVRAELILLQRQTVPDQTAATSQVHEIDCPTGRDRIVANIGYDRAGTPLHAYSVETTLSLRPYMRPVFEVLCNGDYLDSAVTRFDSMSGFLDLYDRF